MSNSIKQPITMPTMAPAGGCDFLAPGESTSGIAKPMVMFKHASNVESTPEGIDFAVPFGVELRTIVLL